MITDTQVSALGVWVDDFRRASLLSIAGETDKHISHSPIITDEACLRETRGCLIHEFDSSR